MGHRSELWRVGALYCCSARLVGSSTIDVVFGLYHMGTLRQHIVEVACGVIARGDISTAMISAKLLDWLHTCSTLVYHLHEIVVTIGSDGDANFHTIANLQILIQDFPFDGQAASVISDILCLLEELSIDSTPRCTIAGLPGNAGVAAPQCAPPDRW